ncbi:MAG TPA: IclR family transcriptional regulator [Acidimicrobiales bacterium]|nr:IclR family transcriptional regulator [Acidimicrobiales bacterium]
MGASVRRPDGQPHATADDPPAAPRGSAPSATAPGGALSGVGVLDKAMAILDRLETGPCLLAELASGTGLPRATAHRLAVALETHGLVGRDGSGRFVLGQRLVGLGRAASQGRRSLSEAASPALALLRDRTGESTQLYVASGEHRVCVLSLESPHSLRMIVPVGAVLPMALGSAGHVLSGRPDAERRGWAQSVEERERGVASVSAPVRVDGRVVAAVSVSGPVERTSRQPGRRYAEAVVAAAREVERALQ